MADLSASEIDFLVSQALAVSDGDFERLMEIKVQLIEVALLSRALKREGLSFKDVQDIVVALGEAQKTISAVFADMDSFEKPGEAQPIEAH